MLDLVEPLDASRNAASRGLGSAKRPGSGARTPLDFASTEHRQAYDALSRQGSTVAEVAAGAGLDLVEARSALGGLELQGLVLKDGVLWRRATART